MQREDNAAAGLGRRAALAGLGALPMAAALPAAAQSAAGARSKVIRFAASTEPTTLDPVVSPLLVTQEHSYLVYDTLFSLDAQFRPQPQMVESVEADPGHAAWTMRLREGLAFHDGSPVTSADVLASIARWATRDTAGRQLATLGLKTEAVDARTFRLRLDTATPFLFEALAKPTSSALFIMREREARGDANRPVAEIVGSGPFRFVKEEHRQGYRLVYERNAAYRPRAEPASYLSGGKDVKIDRVEWMAMPDAATAFAAVQRGELDICSAPPLDLLPTLRGRRDVVVATTNPQGWVPFARMNFLHPPFDRPEARRALQLAVRQTDIVRAAGADEAYGLRECHSYFGCGGANESQAATEALRGAERDEARRLLRAIGYDGTPVVFIAPGDNDILRIIATVTAGQMREAGFTVDLQFSDFASMMARRNRREPPAQGGWNMFPMQAFAFELDSPASNFLLSTPCDGSGYAGWACDPALFDTREAWLREADPARRRQLVERMQVEAARLVPAALLGQYVRPIVHRRQVQGLVQAPVTVMWNIDLAAA
ncbi:ABC transporter substrate-binding protein [Roseococcus pinisoli]|uniref:ABC transporter substrate-binding protein n=1 Tax=Roseococcus pinisoli TaxID=2835040 RepID=A0ABS5QBD2_9PROT|nr:ABC transporter substrate-binding protein [Roseococcus pinisoli]MBS7811002.1 ABC transporter substrate-binding protein [Roseococcus pinisoli]